MPAAWVSKICFMLGEDKGPASGEVYTCLGERGWILLGGGGKCVYVQVFLHERLLSVLTIVCAHAAAGSLKVGLKAGEHSS